MSDASRQRLLGAAEVYALHAVSEAEHAEIENDLRSVDDTARVQFNILVSEIQETLALVSVLDAVEPPAELRTRVLDEIPNTPQAAPTPREKSNVTSMAGHRERRKSKWRTTVMAAAAAVVVAVGGVVVATQVLQNEPTPTQAEQIVAAPDAREAVAEFPGGGTATVSYSRESDSVVVKLDGVPAPEPGKDYQMWFVDGTPRSVGLVTADQLSGDGDTVIDGMGASTNFAFSLEPAGGSPQPTEVLTMVSLTA
ncbi:anti-sigma factor [Rhodococcus sp. B10]|uniref:anti-sigma factor n=1 Tax=Rhodococcus sp. B10 TaxID=2695876 RepID=UPI0014312BC1|nr:anti-sigma factor [Rhodococcus sp. B10]NIL76834.1 Anti-sigma-K factor RskA [Rhodococcus sp. B10]